MSRLFYISLDSKALVDFFRESPWTVDLISTLRKKFMLMKALKLACKAGLQLKIIAGTGDSLGKMCQVPKSLQSVDYHHDESNKNRQIVAQWICVCQITHSDLPFSFLFDMRLYLREKKVRHLNRERSKENRYTYTFLV